MEFIPDSLKLSGNLSVNNLDPESGYPAGWNGGIHAQEIYAEAKVGVGSKGELKISLSKDGDAYLAGKLGIGNTNPDHSLVVGPSGGGRHLVVNDIPTARWGFATGNYNLAIQNDGSGSWETRMLIAKNGNVGIGTTSPQGKLDVRGAILAGSSDIYFTEINHDHTGIGNTAGYAAIENAKNYDALMILGRAGTSKGRCVKLWDYLQVNGNMEITVGGHDYSPLKLN